MTRTLLWRGLLAGLLAAIVAATVARLLAEPAIDAAIAFEARHAAHAPELVSRATQKGAGLYTAMMLYGTALGGLFAILFAACHGRFDRAGRIGPRGLALLLALAAFLVVVLVPALRYPPTPPAVGLHETVQARTAAFFAMLALSLLAAAAAGWTFRRLADRARMPDRLLCALLVYAAAVLLLQTLLPPVDEVPADFPATLLWRFRVAALATQAIFWLVAGDLFGRLAEPLLGGAPASQDGVRA